MADTHLIITRSATEDPPKIPGVEICSFDTIRQRFLQRPWSFMAAYPRIELRTVRKEVLPSPLKTALLLRLMSRGSCTIRDEEGSVVQSGPRHLMQLSSRWISDLLGRRRLLRKMAFRVRELSHSLRAVQGPRSIRRDGRPVYLRTDLCFGLRSGGSVGHIAGVLNHLSPRMQPPLFLTSDRIPTVDSNVETHCLEPESRFWDFAELASFHHNSVYRQQIRQHVDRMTPSFVYQRYSVNNLNGVELACEQQVPFVLEYNGSEVWIARNWGRPLRHEKLSLEIEMLNLQAADLVVVVSDPMREELVDRGISPDRILVNPNGVNPAVYRPDLSGEPVRQRLGLGDRTVLGFIGTFGPWHGAEVLADTFGRLLAKRPELSDQLHLLMIGDGVRMPEVREAIARHGCESSATLTGLVPQTEGPAHLAACDLLMSPHVPNPDGSRFFGSPTKLFEYMAMGRGIVASRLDQIGEILQHGSTGWLVNPGDPLDLLRGMETLIDQPKLARNLGAAARQAALTEYSWQAHTDRILDALEERCLFPDRSIERCAA